MSNAYVRTIDHIIDALKDLRVDVEREVDDLIEQNAKLVQENKDLEDEVEALNDELNNRAGT